MERVSLRRVNEWDAPAMLKLYAPYIGTHATPEELLPDLQCYIRRVDRYTYGLGWLICELAGEPAGFCRLFEDPAEPSNPFRLSVEIYVAATQQRRGVGTALMGLMTEIARHGNRRRISARVPLPNDGARAFFQKLGFSPEGVTKDAMEKHGVHYDAAVFSKVLTPEDPDAERPIKPYLIPNPVYEAAKSKFSEELAEKQLAAGKGRGKVKGAEASCDEKEQKNRENKM